MVDPICRSLRPAGDGHVALLQMTLYPYVHQHVLHIHRCIHFELYSDITNIFDLCAFDIECDQRAIMMPWCMDRTNIYQNPALISVRASAEHHEHLLLPPRLTARGRQLHGPAE